MKDGLRDNTITDILSMIMALCDHNATRTFHIQWKNF